MSEKSMEERVRDAIWSSYGKEEFAQPKNTKDAVHITAGNIIGNNNVVNIYTCQHPTITETQMAELRGLVGQIARQGREPHARIWGRLCRRHHISAARHLPERDYPSARRFLADWLARVEPPHRQPDR